MLRDVDGGSATAARVTVARSLVGCLLTASSLVSITPSCQDKAGGAPRGGAGLVSASGTVGPLRIDHSTAVDIQAFAGPAEYIGAGRFRPLIKEFAAFIAFGYGCHHGRYGIPTMSLDKKTGAPGDSHMDCRTVYFVNQRTGTLAGFTTRSQRFHTAEGVRPGTGFAEAAQREHRTPGDDNGALAVETDTADLFIYPVGGGQSRLSVVGKTVDTLALESRRHMIGLTFV